MAAPETKYKAISNVKIATANGAPISDTGGAFNKAKHLGMKCIVEAAGPTYSVYQAVNLSPTTWVKLTA